MDIRSRNQDLLAGNSPGTSFIFQQSIYTGKGLAELNLVLEAYEVKSCPSRSAPERRNPMEMHRMGMIHFSHIWGRYVSAKKLQASHKEEEDATARGRLGESAAPAFPCSPDPTAKVWGWEEGRLVIHPSSCLRWGSGHPPKFLPCLPNAYIYFAAIARCSMWHIPWEALLLPWRW